MPLFLLILLFLIPQSSSLHIQGTWQTQTFFKFLAKFAFQRTVRIDKTNSQGYIYGNITSLQTLATVNHTTLYPATLVVVHKAYFAEYYKLRNGNSVLVRKDLDEVCARMFDKIDEIAYDASCHDGGREDFLRKIPCPSGGYCVDEDKLQSVVNGAQFTYGVQDINQPRFWYISLVACRRTAPNCTWQHDPQTNITIHYDLHLVNGNPYNKHQNPLEYQFSFDRQDTVELYAFFFMLHLALFAIQMYAATRQKHAISKLLGSVIGIALAANFFHLFHALKFAFDGEGVEAFEIVGDIADVFSQMLFMLLLLLLAKGWAVSRTELGRRYVVFTMWGVYLWTNVLLYVWNMTEIDVIEDIDEWQTWPGILTLTLRFMLMVWFLWELRRTMANERCPTTLQFYLHFGASSLVWFFYLFIMAVIAIYMSALWRYKLTRGVRYSVNFLAYAALTHLLWPMRNQQYSHLKIETDPSDELEEFSQAPHVLHNNHIDVLNHSTVPLIHSRPERA